ncbi:MAG: hypothetical protein QXR97_03850 [Thermoproteota archaeon]
MEKAEETVLKAINEYNKYHSPEAKAKLIKISEKGFTVDFEGLFCFSCGVYDYFEDLIYELKNFVDEDVEILSFKEYGPDKIRVKYGFKRTIQHGKSLKDNA